MQKTILSLLLLLLPAWVASAQATNWQTVLGNSATVIRGSATNASGDYYVIGTYNGTLSLGGTAPTLTSAGGTEDMFLAKFSGSTNTFVWAVSGGGSSGTEDGRSVAVNGNNIYVTGSFQTNALISGSALTATGGLDMYVAKYVDNGTTVTSGGALSGGGGGSDSGFSIAVSGTNVYVAGYMSANATKPVISGTTLTSAGGQDMFVARFTDTGTLGNGSAVSGGGGGLDRGLVVGVNSNGVYVTGFLSANAIAPTIQGAAAANAGGQDMFLAKYTATLGNAGVVSGGGSTNDQGQALTISGNTIYVAGTFTGTASIAGSSLTSAGLADMFMAKYTDSGSGLTNGFAARDGAADTEAVGDVAVAGTTVYVAGSYNNSTTLSGSALTSNGTDAFVAKYTDLGGSLANQGAIDGGSNAAGTSSALTISLSGAQALVAGGVATPATFGSIAVASGTAYVAKLAPASTTLTSIVLGGSSPTNATSVTYTVTFGTSITGLSVSNFSLSPTGTITGPSVTSVTGSGTTYTVTVNTGTGDGTLRLNLANDTGISLSISNSPYTSGPAYTIDKTVPTVAIGSSTAANGGSTSTSPIPFTVAFSENVTGFVAGDVTVTNGTISGFTAVSGTVYTFNVTPTANGAVTVNVPAAVAQDAATNFNTASPGAYSITYTAPTTTVASVTRNTPSPTATATVSYRVVFAASVTGVTASNFTATVVSGSISGASVGTVSGSGTTYTVVVNTGTGDGTLRLNVANSTGISPSVSNVPYTAGEVYTITKSFAAAPSLTIVGAGGTGSDVTAFVDVVQVLSGGSAFANALQNGSFEAHDPLSNGDFGYNPTGASWTFNARSGIAESGSPFTPTTPIPNGIAVAFVQSNGGNGQLRQNLAVPTGTNYQVSFQAAQRECCTTLDQALNVFLNGVFLGAIQPRSSGYSTFTSATFAVTAPALTATLTSAMAANGGSTGTSPIAYTVTFSQAVTGFSAAGVSVSNGTVSGFSGSGTTYTFNVTPAANGVVAVSVPTNSAVDANNTGNTAAGPYSITYSATPTIAGFAADPALVCVGSPLTFTATVGNVTGTYAFTLTNGSSPLSGTATGTAFNRSLVASGSGNQSFTLTVGDNGFQAMATTSVTVNALPVAGLTNNGPLTCAATSVTLTANTGPGLSYRFSDRASQVNGGNTATVNMAGTYSVTVTNGSGCTATASTIVEENKTPPTASLANNGPLTCSQTSVTLTANAGTGLTYRFSSGATQLNGGNTATVNMAGTYSVTVTNGSGCSAMASTTVSEDKTSPTAGLTNNGPLSAAMSSVTLTAAPGGTAYAFSPGASQQGGSSGNTAPVTTPGTYSVIITGANGCTAAAATTVTTTATPTGPQMVCRNSRVVLTTARPAARYEWYKNGQTAANKLSDVASIQVGTTTASLTLVSVQTSATYYVKAIQASGSFTWSGPFSLTVDGRCSARMGLEEPGLSLSVQVAPNPLAGGQLQASVRGAEGGPLTVQLVDARGYVVQAQHWPQASPTEAVSWDVSAQPAGVYILQALTRQQRQTAKVLKL